MTAIYFRTDGNAKIATGHLVRCLAIARACAQEGAYVKFIVSDTESLTLLRERFTIPQEFDVHCLDCDYTKLYQEIPALLSCLASDQDSVQAVRAGKDRPWLFIDSYYADAAYFKVAQGYFQTAYLDDLRTLDCAVDLVINYDTEEDCASYANASRKLLGARYTPLREQFHTPQYEVRPAVRHVLLSTGGIDPYRVAESLLHSIYDQALLAGIFSERQSRDSSKSCPSPAEQNKQNSLPAADEMALLRSMHYHVLTSRTNSRYDALNVLAQEHPSIHIHANVAEVAALMASCDLAVSAGGTTLCELCAVGVPSVSYLMAENQRTAVETYAKRNLIPCAGDIRPVALPKQLIDSGASGTRTSSLSGQYNANTDSLNRTTLSHIIDFLAKMSADCSARRKLSSAMRNFLDGTGAKQIAQAMLFF